MSSMSQNRCRSFRVRILLVSRLLLALTLLLVPTIASASWQTTDFEVIVAEPDRNFGRAGESAADAINRLLVDQAEILKMEHFLHDVAVEYDELGFADPTASGHLGPIIEDVLGNNKVVRVYLLNIPAWSTEYTADKVGLAYYINGVCDQADFGGSILIHRPAAFTNGRITDATYQSLAHELFHAVQAASRFRQGTAGCKVGRWITEGTADAIGFDMGRLLRRLEYPDYNRIENGVPVFLKLWGGRRYHTPLPEADPNQQDDYFSSSFWRHLAEVTWAKKGGRPHPGAVDSKFDYRYLADLFSKRPSGTGTKAELKWVGDWIRGYPHIIEDLSRVYAQFMTSIADYMGEGKRITSVTNLTGDREQRWRTRLFGKCKELMLSKNKPGDDVALSLQRATAACIKVQVAGVQGPIELVFQELDLSKKEQEQLRVGAIGGELVGSPFISECELPGKTLPSCSLWRLPGTGMATHIFVISNMAAIAEDTVNVEPRLHVSIPSWEFTDGGTSPPASASGNEKQPKTRADVEKRSAQLRNSPSRNSAMAAQAGRDKDQPDTACTAQRKNQNLCGPQVNVALTTASPAYPGPGFVGGAGGLLNQMGPAAYSGEEGPITMATLQQQAAATAGRVVSISIPRVAYGFEGSLNNALISVPDGRGDSHESFSTSPDEKGEFLPNGSVSIIEYTPYLLRGTFKASLVSHKDMAKYSPENPSLPVVDEIEGRFSVSAPWRGTDIKPDVGDDSLMMKDMAQDMITILQKMPPELRQSAFAGERINKLCKLGITDSQLRALGINNQCGGQTGVAEVESRCSCACADYLNERDLPQCKTECTIGWEDRQCELSAMPDTGEKDAETRRYEAEVRNWSQMMRYPLAENVIAPQVYIFQISSPDQRQILWEALEKNKLQLAKEQQKEAADAARLQAMPTDGLDAETLRYKAAVEQLNLPPGVAEELVEMFQNNDAAFRETLWQRVRESPLKKQ